MMEQLQPDDQHNRRLASHTHPPDWTNPTAAKRYNLVVVGAGTAGLVAAAGAAGLGARVALVERAWMGGDCLNFGCVPSKALIRSARAAVALREAPHFGIPLETSVDVDFGQVMERLRRLRSEIGIHDSARRFKELGVDVFFGEARFRGRKTLQVGGQMIRFRKAVIATGTRPLVPSIPGLEAGEFATNESIFSLTERPGRMAVIGGGPIGCELAQAFARLGTRVSIIQRGPHLLPREDVDASELLAGVLTREGIDLHLETNVARVTSREGVRFLELESPSGGRRLEADLILTATGRQPNVEDLGLPSAGVRFDHRGVQVNGRLQTTNPRIYAAGDVGMPYHFTHVADASARLVVENALFFGNKRSSDLNIPWCTYTSPEIARVGLSEKDAIQENVKVSIFRSELATVDRAVLDSRTEGFVKILAAKGSDRILGATIVAEHAGEMINEITLAMDAGLGLKFLSKLVHPYPTQAEAIRKAADSYQRSRLSPVLLNLLRGWFRLLR